MLKFDNSTAICSNRPHFPIPCRWLGALSEIVCLSTAMMAFSSSLSEPFLFLAEPRCGFKNLQGRRVTLLELQGMAEPTTQGRIAELQALASTSLGGRPTHEVLPLALVAEVLLPNEEGTYCRTQLKLRLIESVCGRKQRYMLVLQQVECKNQQASHSGVYLVDTRQQHILHASKKVRLTATEVKHLQLIGQGLKPQEIAQHCCNSLGTVLKHRDNIFTKLALNTVAEVKAYIRFMGI